MDTWYALSAAYENQAARIETGPRPE